jgi:glyoxylase-like metal-dependent hydrolase (beta-lactamase superfamily II)
MKKRALLASLAAAAASLLGAKAAEAQQQSFDNVEIQTLKVRDDVYMLVGAGGNITVQTGEDGVLIVDTQFAPLSGKIMAAIRELSDKPLRYIVDTHHHGDHTGGNANLRLAGATVAGGNMGVIRDVGVGAQIIAHENVLFRLSSAKGDEAVPADAWPTDTYFQSEKKLYFNDEGIRIIHMPAAHTDGDSIVFFRKSDVIAAGDVYGTTGYPVIDLAAGGSLEGVVAALDYIRDLIIPVYGQDGGTLVIPGHGRLSNLGDVLNYREMVIVIRDRLKDMIDKGMTLEQVKAAKPTYDYDPRYGATTGFWTTDRFIEAAYRSLAEARSTPQNTQSNAKE